jgi:beta-lactamase class C
MRITTLIAAAVLAASFASRAFAVNDTDVERVIARKLVPDLLNDGIGGMVVAVRIAGRTLFFTYGLADMGAKRPVTPDIRFNIASGRKIFEAIVLAQAVQRGELSFDDPAAKYVTELASGGAISKVTLGQLASHTSGLLLPTDHPPWPHRGYTLPEFIRTLNEWLPAPGHEPGRAHTYTHAGYVLLQLVLERRFGMPIGKLIGERVTGPLGLKDTVLPDHPLDGRRHAPLANAVQGYGDDGAPIGVPGNQQSYYEFPGTGQMFSSARDLATLAAANLGDIPVEPGLAAAMQLSQKPVFRISANNQQALAWEVNDFGGPLIVDKPGGIDNASFYLGLVPVRKLGLVILINRGDRNPHEIARAVILPALERLEGAAR